MYGQGLGWSKTKVLGPMSDLESQVLIRAINPSQNQLNRNHRTRLERLCSRLHSISVKVAGINLLVPSKWYLFPLFR